MATNSQGIFASIFVNGDYDFGEVISASIDGVQADVVEVTPRSSLSYRKQFRAADADDGTLSMVMRTPGGLSVGFVGLKCDLQVTQLSPANTFWDGPAIIQSLAWRATVGELQEYAITFKLGAA